MTIKNPFAVTQQSLVATSLMRRLLGMGIAVALLNVPVSPAPLAAQESLPVSCNCVDQPLESRFKRATRIFRGTILKGEVGPHSHQVSFTVTKTEPMRGAVSSRIPMVTTLRDPCGIRVVANEERIFILDHDQRTVTRCDGPGELSSDQLARFASAIRLLEESDSSSQAAKRVLTPFLAPGLSVSSLQEVLNFAQQLDSSVHFSLEPSRLTFQNLEVNLDGDKVVSYEWR